MQGALELCHGGRLGAGQIRVYGNSDQVCALEQCHGGRIGAMLWRDNFHSAFKGALEQVNGGSTGAVHWIYDELCTGGALGQCLSGNTGEPCRKEWRNTLEEGLEHCSSGAL